jgi:hypothetical protein
MANIYHLKISPNQLRVSAGSTLGNLFGRYSSIETKSSGWRRLSFIGSSWVSYQRRAMYGVQIFVCSVCAVEFFSGIAKNLNTGSRKGWRESACKISGITLFIIPKQTRYRSRQLLSRVEASVNFCMWLVCKFVFRLRRQFGIALRLAVNQPPVSANGFHWRRKDYMSDDSSAKGLGREDPKVHWREFKMRVTSTFCPGACSSGVDRWFS